MCYTLYRKTIFISVTCIASTRQVKRRSELTWPRGYKTFSAEHEICIANKSQITNYFLANIAEHEHFSANKNKKTFSYLLTDPKFHAQLG